MSSRTVTPCLNFACAALRNNGRRASPLCRLGAVSGGRVLRKLHASSHRRTWDHLQRASVHGVRVQLVRYVELVSRYITVQVRSQNSNPTEPGEVHNYGPLTTHIRPACNAGRWSNSKRRKRWRRLRRRSAHRRCVCQPTRQTIVTAQIPTLITGIGACALLHCSAASLATISTQDPVASSRHAWAE